MIARQSGERRGFSSHKAFLDLGFDYPNSSIRYKAERAHQPNEVYSTGQSSGSIAKQNEEMPELLISYTPFAV